MIFSRDTSAEAERVLLERLRAMCVPERMAALDACWRAGMELVDGGIRARRPNASDEEVFAERLRLLHGPELAEIVLQQRALRHAAP